MRLLTKKLIVEAAFWLACVLMVGVLLLLCPGCSSGRQMASPQVVELRSTDSVAVVRVERIDTVMVRLPAQMASAEVRDTVSRLHTDYAESYAAVTADGTLRHWLRNKELPVAAEVVVTSDTVVRYVFREVPVRVEVPVEVPAQLTRWQRVRLASWPWLLAAAVAAAATLLRRFRKIFAK